MYVDDFAFFLFFFLLGGVGGGGGGEGGGGRDDCCPEGVNYLTHMRAVADLLVHQQQRLNYRQEDKKCLDSEA